MLIVFVLLLSFALSSCEPYNEDNAKTLIMARVPKCVNITMVVSGNCDYYAAVDSAYNIHSFKINSFGEVEELNTKK